MYFGSHPLNEPCTTNLTMLNDLNCRLNNLLADFALCSSSALSALFRTYCMNIYGSQIRPYSMNYPNTFYISWRNAIGRLCKIRYRTDNKCLHIVNNCMSIDVTLGKLCINYVWNLINSKCKACCFIIIILFIITYYVAQLFWIVIL